MREFLSDKNRLAIAAVGVFVLILLIIILVIVTINRAQPPTSGVGVPTDNVANGNQNTPDNTGQNPQPTQRTNVIRWWGAFLSTADVQTLIDNYEAANPTVDIQYTQQVFVGSELPSYRQRVQDSLAAGDAAAEVFMADSGWIGSLNNNLSPAPSGIANSESFNQNFHDFTANALVRSGQVYGLPLWVDNLALVYNKKLYSEAGLTIPSDNWNVFANDQVPRLTKSEANSNNLAQSGFAAGLPANSEFWFEVTNILLLQNDVTLKNDAGQAVFADSQASTTAVDFYKQFATNTSAKSWDASFNLDIAAFLEGKAATIATTSWRLSDIIRYNQNAGLNLDFGIAPLPQLSAQNSSNWGIYWANVVKRNNFNNEEVWKFVNYLSEPEQLQILNQTLKSNNATSTGILFPRKLMTPEQSTDQYLSVYARALGYSQNVNWMNEPLIKPRFAELYTGSKNMSILQSEVNAILLQ